MIGWRYSFFFLIYGYLLFIIYYYYLGWAYLIIYSFWCVYCNRSTGILYFVSSMAASFSANNCKCLLLFAIPNNFWILYSFVFISIVLCYLSYPYKDYKLKDRYGFWTVIYSLSLMAENWLATVYFHRDDYILFRMTLLRFNLFDLTLATTLFSTLSAFYYLLLLYDWWGLMAQPYLLSLCISFCVNL